MKATLLSYLPGMSGDFLSFLIHKDPKFYEIQNESIVEGIKITEHNKWNFPNLLKPIGLEAKIYPNNRSWKIGSDDINILKSIYGNQQIMLPSHWYNDIESNSTDYIFDSAIRLFAKDKNILKICYALWWIKSHVVANEIWPHRKEEIIEMFYSNFSHKDLLVKILSSYHNWKFLSVKYNFLNDGKLDLDFYIRKHFSEIYTKNNYVFKDNYRIIDVDNIFYKEDNQNISIIEDIFKVTLDRKIIASYIEKNFKILENCLGIKIDSSNFENDDNYFDAIIKYAKDVMKKNPSQTEYFKGIK